MPTSIWPPNFLREPAFECHQALLDLCEASMEESELQYFLHMALGGLSWEWSAGASRRVTGFVFGRLETGSQQTRTSGRPDSILCTNKSNKRQLWPGRLNNCSQGHTACQPGSQTGYWDLETVSNMYSLCCPSSWPKRLKLL